MVLKAMPALITKDILVAVETAFQPGYSQPNSPENIFAYRITIRNNGQQTVQLLSRHWFIRDGVMEIREVKGEGVIGQQPVIEPGQQHQYISMCNLKGQLGKMWGFYEFVNVENGNRFEVEIPAFVMATPVVLN